MLTLLSPTRPEPFRRSNSWAFLGLVDDEGGVTNNFRRLQQAGTSEYPATLAEILQKIYHPVFNVVDPARTGYVRRTSHNLHYSTHSGE